MASVEIDLWLRGGGLVVAASERAARAVGAAFHRARRAEGLAAWPAPNIHDWRSFVGGAWQARSLDQRLPLNALQEHLLWAEIVGATERGSALLAGPRHRLAALGMGAHELLCDYAPQFLNEVARNGWQQDAGVFSGWLADFQRVCRFGSLIAAARLPLELQRHLEADAAERPPLLLAGFDRILPIQRKVFDAWGTWREAPRGEVATELRFYEAPDAQTELAACALWSKQRLAAQPSARLLVVTRDLLHRRGEIERAFLRFGDGVAPLFEFSLGVPLSQVALVRAALLVLRWLCDPIEEHELDWLISSGKTANAAESQKLAAFMRAIRGRGWERPGWRFEEFIRQRPGTELLASWAARMTQARRRLEASTRPLGSTGGADAADPFTWAELAPQLLDAAGWPGARPLTSAEFQALRRWQRALDECASLGFNGRRMSWREFLLVLGRALDETLFAPESRDPPIQIAGPAESAGLIAEGVWFLGATEDSWPATGATHPLLPFEIQRQAAMPHASPQLDWGFAHSITRRLLASGSEVHFSYPRQSEDLEMRPSRVIAQVAGPSRPLPSKYLAPPAPAPIAVAFPDFSRIPLFAGEAPGGSSILTAQSQCAFKALATARLGAQGWKPAQAGFTAAQRGQLLHAMLRGIWGGAPAGIRSHAELLAKADDCRAFVEGHARNALRNSLPATVRERMPQRYLELEETRLVDLVTEWLAFEATRVPFVVAGVEVPASPSIAGLTLHLRLDRIDRLADGSLLVVDYKSGNVSPSAWELPRPDEVQLPLYAGFGLDDDLRAELAKDSREVAAANTDAESEGRLGGLVFAKVRAGEHFFAGRVGDAKALLLSDLHAGCALVRRKLAAEELIAWREYIEQMARDFLAGRADVNPRQHPQTCEHCDLHALCRIQEGQAQPDESEWEEVSDE